MPEKIREPTNPEDPTSFFENLEYGIIISQKAGIGNSVNYRNVLDRGSISFKKHEIAILYYGSNIYPKAGHGHFVIWDQ